MAQLFANAARSTLVASVTSTATQLSINPADQGLFPVATGADFFKVALQDTSGNIEYVKVQRAVGQSILDVFTGGRATEDSAKFPARAFNAGSLVELRMTAADLASSIAHPGQATGAHAATAIANTPAGGIAATTVQDAIDELDTEKIGRAVDAWLSSLDGLARLFFGDGATTYINGFDAIPIQFRGGPDGTNLLGQFTSDGTLSTTHDATLDGDVPRFLQVKNLIVPKGIPGQFITMPRDTLPTGYTGLPLFLVTGQHIDITSPTYSSLAYLYCGDASNAVANSDFFYRCTDPLNPSTTRSTTGAYLKLPNPGYFLRTLNNTGSGVDSARSAFKYQADAVGPLEISLLASSANGGSKAITDPVANGVMGAAGDTSGHQSAPGGQPATKLVLPTNTGTETVVKNWGAYIFMWR